MSDIKEKWTIKRILKEVLTTLVLLFIISQVINFIRKPEIKENIYTYQLHDIENQAIDFFDYKEETLVVHFWGTWCPTCKLEASNIQTLSDQYNVISIAVNSGTDEVLAKYMDEHNLDYKVINDTKGALAAKFNIEAYPTTLIYNTKGELKFTEVGYSTTLGLKARLELIN
ncbi:MAG: Membrane protein, suppressor for copper-sensitivity ScsD [uncultured Sulfurovum sp.]|uniref:Membrane protein, suppressor for copper-sensitivity ScsD n=1 Tax=uncultured Sulfurovum sp. TaxID=269237 RepID=A0A6S6U5C8_9BACT|nr:MAG: Membrane protein, suppressor for copper-sensitivity ScsD [uncultured Sulfurovum sp.]